VPVLAACGSADSGGPAPEVRGTVDASGGIKTSEIPVGGGKIFADQKYVVTQPKAGEFKAFSAICTHQGCAVSKIAAGAIDCPCHGSSYSIEDGSVLGGPAPRPLPAKTVTQTGDTLTVS
jgi:Rieske Fe-S protein